MDNNYKTIDLSEWLDSIIKLSNLPDSAIYNILSGLKEYDCSLAYFILSEQIINPDKLFDLIQSYPDTSLLQDNIFISAITKKVNELRELYKHPVISNE